MRRYVAIAALAASLFSLAACSAGSSSAVPTTSQQSGAVGGFIHEGR